MEARGIIQNLTGRWHDRYLSVDCQEGFWAPDNPGKNHMGTWPQNMHNFVRQKHFQQWLRTLLQELGQHRSPAGQPPNLVHVLLWCNEGTHNAVSASRILEVAAAECGIPCLPRFQEFLLF